MEEYPSSTIKRKWYKSPFLQAAAGFVVLVGIVRLLNTYYESEGLQHKQKLQQEVDSLQSKVDSLKLEVVEEGN